MTTLSGWGLNFRSDCELVEPETSRAVAKALDTNVLPRGLGRSYGDVALNSGHRVLGLTRLDRFLAFDELTGVLRCEAGVSLAQVIHAFAPQGWFPLITPGTKFVTVGGCIANDVHGKAHHAQGTFVTGVKSMRVLLASGDTVTASRDENAELFWAQFGGVGLLGVILEATLQLRRIETTWFRQKSVVCDSLEALVDAIDAEGASFSYSVANVDLGATGQHLGRGVLTVGEHASLSELPRGKPPLKVSGAPLVDVPVELPSFALNRVTARMLNGVIDQMLKRAPDFSHYDSFFYPLDILSNWNRGYGPRGFTQYQFVIPLADGKRRLRELLETVVGSGEQPFLNVLKRMGPANQAPLSFPFEGYTLAIDFPIRAGTAALCERLDAMVLEAGGRVYLGKDSYLSAATFRAMYPRLDEWLALKRRYDPRSVFQSDLGRRVGLV